MSGSRPTERAMKAAVEMEVHATIGTTTIAKGAVLDKWFPEYDQLKDACKALYEAFDIMSDGPDDSDEAMAAVLLITAVKKAKDAIARAELTP